MLGPVAAWITALTRGTMAGWNQVLSQPVWQLDVILWLRPLPPPLSPWTFGWMTSLNDTYHSLLFLLSFQPPFVSSSLVTARTHQLCLASAGYWLSVRELGAGVNEKTLCFRRRLGERRENVTDKDCSVMRGPLERFSFLVSNGVQSQCLWCWPEIIHNQYLSVHPSCYWRTTFKMLTFRIKSSFWQHDRQHEERGWLFFFNFINHVKLLCPSQSSSNLETYLSFSWFTPEYKPINQ